ncbi:hypothetical protein [Synechococcus sp. MU1625]|uniref:hypothetical protein n=1 Tax=Synechococcus sp. MU1625 TaxID=2508347 RepID=UPI001CF845B7|nr:hypothetical protein [Synechococcus sp. MU1625]MCB4400386.1 hypothetical protein [Synechococcus sp. MU1625]
MNFLLVLGTQKCGTTWLGSAIGRHPQYFRVMKEWRSLAEIEKKFLENKEEFKAKEIPVYLKNLSQEEFMAFPLKERRKYASDGLSNYFSVAVSAFQWTKKGVEKDIKAVGDITGVNGTLDEEFLYLYKNVAKSLGINLKPTYLMRDPVSRHFSAVRMIFWNKVLGNRKSMCEGFSVEEHAQMLHQFCLECLDSDKFKKRASYEKIVPKIERVFGREEILFCFSEDLRKPDSINQFIDYLELDPLKYNSKEVSQLRANVGSLEYRFPDEIIEKVYDRYRSTYSFVRNRFGASVPIDWLNLSK